MTENTKTVRMLVNISGTRDGEDWPAKGQTLDAPAAEAADLIRMGIAADEDAAETATPDGSDIENATRQGNRSLRSQKAAEAKAAAEAQAAAEADTKAAAAEAQQAAEADAKARADAETQAAAEKSAGK